MLFLVPTHHGITGGEVYNRKVETHLRTLAAVEVVEVAPLAQQVMVRASPFLRRYAFAPSFGELATGLVLARRHAGFDGVVLVDYEISRYTDG